MWAISKGASAEIQGSGNGWKPGPVWWPWVMKDRTWGEAPDFAGVGLRIGWDSQ